MTTIRLPPLSPAQLRATARELAAAARAAELAASAAEREAADAAARKARLRAALEARRTAHRRRAASLALAILRAAPAATIAQSEGVSVRTVERARAELAARLSAGA